MTLNERARRLADQMIADGDELRIAVSCVAGARVIDCGLAVPGGLRAGLALARVCLADRAEVALLPGERGPLIQVTTDHPVAACMASQYAGWSISVGKYFAMGSGPMRARYGQEALFAQLPGRERAACAVGTLETRQPPSEDVVTWLCSKLELPGNALTLLAAPAASLAGTLQVVARCLETALHKLHELGFDLTQVVSGIGTAPLPPPAADELTAIGRTNDAILYGGRAVLYVRASDDALTTIGPQVPSSASPDHGEPFVDIFRRAGDFYKIDPLLFSPAEIVLCNLTSGRAFTFGRPEPAIWQRSFGL